MNQNSYVIGIDGGGTKTTAVLCSLDGAILAEAQDGPSNFQIVGIEKSANTLLDIIESCCHSIRCNASEIGAIMAGIAGAGRTSDQQRLVDEMFAAAKKRNIILNKLFVDSDARIALEGAFGCRHGIIIIGGTGSIVFGKDEREKIYRAGGWGRIIRDEGSGYAIGQEAFRAVAKSLDGFSEKTKLAKLFEIKFNLGTQESIINALYKDKFDVASVATTVIEAASRNDKIAKKILKNAADELIENVKIVINKMNKGVKNAPMRPLAMTGSLLADPNIYSKMVRSLIRRNVPHISICEPESSPVVGAALMAIGLFKS